jgi:hypothetical protein
VGGVSLTNLVARIVSGAVPFSTQVTSGIEMTVARIGQELIGLCPAILTDALRKHRLVDPRHSPL